MSELNSMHMWWILKKIRTFFERNTILGIMPCSSDLIGDGGWNRLREIGADRFWKREVEKARKNSTTQRKMIGRRKFKDSDTAVNIAKLAVSEKAATYTFAVPYRQGEGRHGCLDEMAGCSMDQFWPFLSKIETFLLKHRANVAGGFLSLGRST